MFRKNNNKCTFFFEDAKLAHLNWHGRESNLRPQGGAHFQIAGQYHQGQPKWVLINASSNLKRGLHLRTKIKSNACLDIGTEGVVHKRKKNQIYRMCISYRENRRCTNKYRMCVNPYLL